MKDGFKLYPGITIQIFGIVGKEGLPRFLMETEDLI